MAQRVDLTPEVALRRAERKRESDKLAARRYRARGRLARQTNGAPVSTTHQSDAPAPPGPPTPPSPRGSYGTPPGGPKRPRGNPRVSAVIDGLRARGLPDALNGRDRGAIKQSTVEPEQAVEAFEAAYRKRWGNGWLQDNLSMWAVLERFAAYEATKRPRAAAVAPRGAEASVVFEAPLKRVPPAEVSRAMAERARLPLKEKLALVKNGRPG